MYRLATTEEYDAELSRLPAPDRTRIEDVLRRTLKDAPNRPTRKIKPLRPRLNEPWPTELIWQIRIGDFRVWYDVDEPNQIVILRGVAPKGRKTTKEIRP